MLGHADLSTLRVTEPSPTDWRHGRLEPLVDAVDGCETITWRVLGDRCDALVIDAGPQADPAPVMARLAEPDSARPDADQPAANSRSPGSTAPASTSASARTSA